MLREPAGTSVEYQSNRKHLEHQFCEAVKEVYQTIHTAGLYKFTSPWIDSLWNDVNEIVYDLDRLPEPSFRELMGVILGLSEARNELRLACFLFDVEEIDPVHRLIMRNRAVLRGEIILQKTLQTWP